MKAMVRFSPADRRARQQVLIAGIAAGRSVIDAAGEAGIGWRRAYVWRAEEPAFRAAWDKARAQIKARVPPPAELTVPPLPDQPTLPGLQVPPSPALPPLPPPPQPVRVTVRSFDFENDDDEEGGSEGTIS